MLVMLAFLVLMVMFVFQTRLVVVFVTFKSLDGPVLELYHPASLDGGQFLI